MNRTSNSSDVDTSIIGHVMYVVSPAMGCLGSMARAVSKPSLACASSPSASLWYTPSHAWAAAWQLDATAAEAVHSSAAFWTFASVLATLCLRSLLYPLAIDPFCWSVSMCCEALLGWAAAVSAGEAANAAACCGNSCASASLKGLLGASASSARACLDAAEVFDDFCA